MTVTVVATMAIGGPLVVSETFGGSATGSSDFAIQVKIDLNKALDALAAVFGFRSTRGLDSGTSGPSYHSDCAKSATGKVKAFLALNHCKRYATAIRPITKPGTITKVAFTWVEMPTASSADKYQFLVNKPRTGNPPGVSLAFNGFCYASGEQGGTTVWTVLVQPTGNVNVDRDILQVAARRKLTPTYLRWHCIS